METLSGARSAVNALIFLTLGCASAQAGVRFEISYAREARAEPLTGRVYVILSREGRGTPLQQISPTGVPFFGKDVDALAPGEQVMIDGSALGYPLASVDELPPGEYTAQAFFNVYTECARADGHTVWVHLDRGEGQDWKRSPGNLYSTPVKIKLDPQADAPIRLACDKAIAPIEPPADTDWVKHLRIQSVILSKWWGQPIFLGATVLLPKGYEQHPDARYPVHYLQDHFSTRPPAGFGRGGRFDAYWQAEGTPRMLYVTFQHPTPYYDDSYAVNSANTGPYGDAILQELIPEVERRFRAIREPWARLLSGGSTGGWEALALQIFHPDFFGGCFASCPDSPDFRYLQLVDIYKDENAYFVDEGWMKVERPALRRTDGNVQYMMKDENWFELVCGERSRSSGQWDVWEATYGPVGSDGYPKRIWDKRSGAIDREVAKYWKEHYDLRHLLETNWKSLGPKLVGKLHVWCGDMDSYYLNNGVGLLERFLESTKEPHYAGSFTYGRLKGHGFGPGGQELHEILVQHVDKYAPKDAELKSWRY